jgi:hypothetical protein
VFWDGCQQVRLTAIYLIRKLKLSSNFVFKYLRDGATATGAGAAFFGAAGAVWIAGGIARYSSGQTQKSLPDWQAFSFLTL